MWNWKIRFLVAVQVEKTGFLVVHLFLSDRSQETTLKYCTFVKAVSMHSESNRTIHLLGKAGASYHIYPVKSF